VQHELGLVGGDHLGLQDSIVSSKRIAHSIAASGFSAIPPIAWHATPGGGRRAVLRDVISPWSS
jgi:hypothetical protein